MSIKAILFDIGEVLLEINSNNFFESLNLPPSSEVSDFLDSKLHHDFEKGRVTADDFLCELSHNLKIDGLSRIQVAWNSIINREVSGIKSLLNQLSESYQLYCLTNTNSIHHDHFMTKFDIFQLFDEIYASHELGFRKPESSAYHLAIEKMGAMPNEVLFFDDRIENIKAAREVGLVAFQVSRSATRIKEIIELN